MKTFPDNKISSFRTKLPAPINLNNTGQAPHWEVGLSEILYPKTWFNITSDSGLDSDVFLTVLSFMPQPPPHQGGMLKEVTCILPAGLYTSVQELIQTLNSLLEQKDSDVTFGLVSYQRKVHVRLGPTVGSITMSAGLQQRLGFTRSAFQGAIPPTTNAQDTSSHLDGDTMEDTRSGRVYSAKRLPDLNAGLSALYVYCDMVQPRPVGDVTVPLLRVAPIKGFPGDTVAVSFQPVHYLSASKTIFDTIEIDIRDDVGRLVPFESGKVVVTLHFRPRRP